MEPGLTMIITAVLLGVGLAMDAFSVSLANGLNEPCMKLRKLCFIAGIFALFQALMPLAGWVLVHSFVQHFKSFEKFIPWIALILLSFIGGKMLFEGVTNKDEDVCTPGVGFGALIIQGVATSIDALSVGFTISDYNFAQALISALIIAAVTYIICTIGLVIGKKAGTKLAGKAGILGGVILILIGIEIFATGIM